MNNNIERVQSYLTFRLGDETFAANVKQVLEILEIPRITKVPHSPDAMRGVINLRGNVMPVINARLKFGLPDAPDTVTSCIIVMELQIEDQQVALGAVVDAVQEVIEISDESLQPAPSIGSKYKSEFIRGMAKINDQFIMILDLDLIFSTDEATILQEIVEDVESEQE
jgi:purine-binding chemotaxis protein CheW